MVPGSALPVAVGDTTRNGARAVKVWDLGVSTAALVSSASPALVALLDKLAVRCVQVGALPGVVALAEEAVVNFRHIVS